MKPCSRDTEKPCGYRVEVPQHSETSQRCQKCKRRHNCVKQWNRPEIRITEIFQLPTTKCQAPRYKCWVRPGSSTWIFLWSWNNNERRLRLLEKNNWRKQLRSLQTDWRQSQTKLETKQRLKTLTLLEHCHAYLFDVLWIYTLHTYCESSLGESNLRWHKKIIILKNNLKL